LYFESISLSEYLLKLVKKCIICIKCTFKIQQNFDNLLQLEEKIIKLNNKIQEQDLSYRKFKKATDSIANLKNKITNEFLNAQDLIITSFFDNKMKELNNASQIEQYRKCLYSFSNLIGRTDNYSFFNDYYIDKMSQLDIKYEQITGHSHDMSLTVVKESKVAIFFKTLKKIFVGNSSVYDENNDW
jgi:hypothetical protein